jgi:hypothetical protein
MPSMIDQIRASKLPSGMMQFAARGALQVPPAENIEILVYLALHNKVFGDLAKMTLAGWDEKSSLAAAADPKTPAEVLGYLISPDNLRPALLPALLENPSVSEAVIMKLAISAGRETIESMLKSARVRSLRAVLETLKSNPYLKKEEVEALKNPAKQGSTPPQPAPSKIEPVTADHSDSPAPVQKVAVEMAAVTGGSVPAAEIDGVAETDDESISAYLAEHANEIAAEGSKTFQAIGGTFDLERVVEQTESSGAAAAASVPVESISAATVNASAATAGAAAKPAVAKKQEPEDAGKRVNTLQKINALDVKGRIQLALKGNKEERSILVRDGTKVVALAVLEAPKLSDGEVEKIASQKNVLEAVLRQIPLKRRFMKNYIVVRNLVANPRTPLDLGLGLMKNILPADLKNISSNKDVSETIRKLALKMYKQKMEAANKK